MFEAREYNKTFARKLRYYLERSNMSQAELAAKLGVSPQSVTNWANAVKTPRMDKIDAMCAIFGCSRFDLADDKESDAEQFDTWSYLQELKDRSEMRMLFKSAQGATKEQIEAIVNLLESMKGK